jgi:hypothetical protein
MKGMKPAADALTLFTKFIEPQSIARIVPLHNHWQRTRHRDLKADIWEQAECKIYQQLSAGPQSQIKTSSITNSSQRKPRETRTR